jgi:XTP/dITP diphosphohydrolase
VRLLLATSNPGKVREMRRLLAGVPVDVITPADLSLDLEVDEDGATYAENAARKARAYAEAAGLVALADDSGLEVDALAGRPGLHSARYGAPGLDDADRTALLLTELRTIPDGRRTARYRAVVAVAWPGGRVEYFCGSQEGTIARETRGKGGFGYDPIFVTRDGRTAAELDEQEKDAVSHRGQAMRAAVEFLSRELRACS